VVGVIIVQNRRVARERDDAYAARNKSEMVVTLMREALSADDPYKPGREKTVRASLEYLLGELDARHHDDPSLRASVRHTIGMVDLSLGDFDAAQKLLTQAYEERTAFFGTLHPDVAESLMGLGEHRFRTGQYERAVELFRDALRVYEAAAPDRTAEISGARNDLGVAIRATGDNVGALRELELSRQLRDPPRTPEGELELAETLNNLANVHVGLGDFAAAHECMRRSLELRRAQLADDHALTVQSKNNLAFIAINEGQFALARQLLEEAVPVEAKALGADHPQHAGTLQNLGRALLGLREYEEAESVLVKALAIRVSKLSPTDARTVRTREYLIRALVPQGEHEAAETLLAEAIAPFTDPAEREKTERQLAPAACLLYEAWGKPERLAHWQSLR